MRHYTILFLAGLLLGCGQSSIKHSGLTIVSPEWAMPAQEPLSVGFWNASARVAVYNDPSERGRESVMSVDVSSVLERPLPDRSWGALDSILASDEKRGFVRLIPTYLVGIKEGTANPPKLEPAATMSGNGYWLSERFPDIPKGFKLVKETTRLESLPIVFKTAGYKNGGALFKFDQGKIKWDLRTIDVDPSDEYVISFNSSWKSRLSSKPSGHRNRPVEVGNHKMDPLVFVKVNRYELQSVDSNKTEVREVLSGWIEGAGRFTVGSAY